MKFFDSIPHRLNAGDELRVANPDGTWNPVSDMAGEYGGGVMRSWFSVAFLYEDN